MTTSGDASEQAGHRWRRHDAIAVWLVVAGGALLALALLGQEFAWGLGQALHANPDAEDRVPHFWGFIALAAILTVAAIAALVARRWVAFALSVVLALGTGMLAAGIYR